MKDSTKWGLLGAAILTATGVGSYIFEKSAYRTAQESLRTAERLVRPSDGQMRFNSVDDAMNALNSAGNYIKGATNPREDKPFWIGQRDLIVLQGDYTTTSKIVHTAWNAAKDSTRKEMLDIQNALNDRTPGHSPYHPKK